MSALTRCDSIGVLPSDCWHIIPENFRPEGCESAFYRFSEKAREIEYTFCCQESVRPFTSRLAEWSRDHLPVFILSSIDDTTIRLHFTKEEAPLKISIKIAELVWNLQAPLCFKKER